jgi:hypothetical protein
MASIFASLAAASSRWVLRSQIRIASRIAARK